MNLFIFLVEINEKLIGLKKKMIDFYILNSFILMIFGIWTVSRNMIEYDELVCIKSTKLLFAF